MKTIALQNAIPYVAAAYIGIWVVFFGYLIVLGSRLSNLNKQVEALKEAVESRGKKASAETGVLAEKSFSQ